MSKYFFSTLVFVLLVSNLLTACRQSEPPFECTDEIGCVTLAPDEAIKLGVLQDTSAGAVPLAIDQIRSVELALSKRTHQLLGHAIETINLDGECTPSGGANAALQMAADPQVVGIIGTQCSASAVGAGQVMSEAGLVMISGGNGSPSLTSLNGVQGADWQPGYFRTMYNAEVEAEAMANFVFQVGASRLAMVNNGDAVSLGIAQNAANVFTQLGGEIVLDERVNIDDVDMQPILTAIANARPDFTLILLFPPEAAAIITQASAMPELKDVPIISTSPLATETFVQAVGLDGIGTHLISVNVPASVAVDELEANYVQTFGERPAHSAFYVFGYDATNLLLDSIAKVAVQEADGTLYIGRQALRNALYGTVNFEGVSGKLTCDQFGDCGAPQYGIMRLDDPAAGIEGLRSNIVYTYEPEK